LAAGDAQALEQHGRQRDIAWYAAFAFADVDHHFRAIDIANLKMKQFVEAEGSGVQRGNDGPVQQVGSPVQEAGDGGRVDDIRQSRDALGACDLVIEPGLFESFDIKEVERGAVDLQRIGAHLPLIDQVEQILPDLFRAEAFGRGMEVPGEALDSLQIDASSLRGEVAQLQLLDHTFA
jgi:hypothetical protein